VRAGYAAGMESKGTPAQKRTGRNLLVTGADFTRVGDRKKIPEKGHK